MKPRGVTMQGEESGYAENWGFCGKKMELEGGYSRRVSDEGRFPMIVRVGVSGGLSGSVDVVLV